MFTADGHFSTNIIRPGRSKFASNNSATGTPEENKEAVVGSTSSFGSYTVSSDGSINLNDHVSRQAEIQKSYRDRKRRLRELVEEGVLEVQYRRGHAFYRIAITPNMEAWFDDL